MQWRQAWNFQTVDSMTVHFGSADGVTAVLQKERNWFENSLHPKLWFWASDELQREMKVHQEHQKVLYEQLHK